METDWWKARIAQQRSIVAAHKRTVNYFHGRLLRGGGADAAREEAVALFRLNEARRTLAELIEAKKGETK